MAWRYRSSAALRGRLQLEHARTTLPADQSYRAAIKAGRGVVAEEIQREDPLGVLKSPDAPRSGRIGLADVTEHETLPARFAFPSRPLTGPATRAALDPARMISAVGYAKREAASLPVGYKPSMHDVASLMPRPKTETQRRQLFDLKRIATAERSRPKTQMRLGIGLHPVDIANGALNPKRGKSAHPKTQLHRFISIHRRQVPEHALAVSEHEALHPIVQPRGSSEPAPPPGVRPKSEAVVLDDLPAKSLPVTREAAIAATREGGEAAAPSESGPMQWVFLAAVVFVAFLLLKRGA